MTLVNLTDYQYPLTTLERVKLHMGNEYGTLNDVEIGRLINECSSQVETRCKRHMRSRVWTHDGTTLPRYSSEAKATLFLRERPITAVSVLKLFPGATALTEGWDQDFIVHAQEGVIELLRSNFFSGKNIVEITYTAGYVDDPAAGQRSVYGWNVGAADLELGVVQLVAWAYNQKRRDRENVSSRSEGGVTVSFIDGPKSAWELILQYRNLE